MKFFLLAVVLITSLQGLASTMPADSVGIEKKGGKTFILHRVEEKETLYSLSRRYNVPINQIVENNAPSEFGLEIGQIIRVPLLKKASKEQKAEVKRQQNVHVVKPKETMFSISKMYSVSIEDIRKWNNLDGNVLDIGQELVIENSGTKNDTTPQIKAPAKRGVTHVVKPGETLYAISRTFNVTIDQLRTWNDLLSNDISIGQELFVSRPAIITAPDDRPLVLQEPVSKETVGATIGDTPEKNKLPGEGQSNSSVNADKNVPVETAPEKGTTTFAEVSEDGLAELIEGSENTRKYLALHRTAKIGTIMRVRNEMNDQEVFVRVLGRLPDTGVNENVLIKISKSAYDRLGAIDAKFRVSISYIP